MGDNTNTEKLEDHNYSSTLKDLVNIHKSALLLGIYVESGIKCIEQSQLYASTPKGQVWVQTLLASHPDRIRRELGLRKKVFEQLVQELVACGYTPSEGITLEEQLAIFLYICTTSLSCRLVGELLDRSSATINKYFCKILEAFSAPPIYTKYVKLPRSDDTTPACIANDDTLYPFFKDVIGAIDGMHTVFAPTTRKGVYRNSRGSYSQYCLVCCNLDLEFTFVISGWEGSVHDEKVYCDARRKDLGVLAGKHYLADVAFPACPQLSVPYSIQHHLPNWEREEMRSGTNAHDYFNRRHAELRCVVEQAIYLLKRRFRILVVAPDVEEKIQSRIPSALCCIHNIIRHRDPKDMEGDEIERTPGTSSIARSARKSKKTSPEVNNNGSLAKYGFITVDERDAMVGKREEIANWLWKDYLSQYPRSQDHII